MTKQNLSIIRAKPLSEEAGLGALTLPGWLKEVTDKFGPREACVMYENGHVIRWTYNDLWSRANEVARALVASGVGKGTRVGIMMTNRPEFLSAVWGAALAGGIATTISTFSTPDELDYLLSTSAVSVLLIERKIIRKDFCEIIGALDEAISSGQTGAIKSTKFPFLTHMAAIGGGDGAIENWDDFLRRGDAVDQQFVDARAATISPSDAGVLFFSSGSTAKPKGILSAHRAVSIQLWRWPRFYQTAQDARTWSANGFFFSGNFGMAIGGTLSVGGALILQSTFQPDEALELMEKEKVSMALAWPHQWPQLAASPKFAGADLSSMKYIGASTPLAQHPSCNVNWEEPLSAYGNTETFTISSIFQSGTPAERKAGSSGEPQPGFIFKIVEPMSGETTPMGERGEIAVKGPTLMMGYLGVPLDETLDEQGFFRTGDGGYVDKEGRLFWEGRLNDIIKTGGANVSPLEIDDVIRSCPGVKMNLTVGVPHETLGEIVVTGVIPHDGAELTEDAIRAFTKEKLASYKVPRRVLFLTEDDIATTGSAKLKTADLRTLAAKRLEGELG